MTIVELRDWYLRNGVNEGEFCIGPEHPAMENLAIQLLEKKPQKRVLEIGYQSGGFAIPVISKFGRIPGFHYTGIDNLQFHGNWQGGWNLSLLTKCLDEHEIPRTAYEFQQGDAKHFLCQCAEKYDLILIDHLKSLYVRELKTILQKKLIQPSGHILLHDVTKRAKQAWSDCKKWCESFGGTWEVHDEVASGLAVVVSGNGYRSKGLMFEKYLEIKGSILKVSRRLG